MVTGDPPGAIRLPQARVMRCLVKFSSKYDPHPGCYRFEWAPWTGKMT